MRCVLAWQLEEDRLARLMRFALDQALLRAITEYSGLTQESQRPGAMVLEGRGEDDSAPLTVHVCRICNSVHVGK